METSSLSLRSLFGNQADHDAVQFSTAVIRRSQTVRRLASVWFHGVECSWFGCSHCATIRHLCYPCTHGPYNEPGPGFLGHLTAPFRTNGANQRRHGAQRVSLERLADRKSLLKSVTSSQRHRRYHDDDRHGYIYRTGHGPADIITSGRSTRSVPKKIRMS